MAHSPPAGEPVFPVDRLVRLATDAAGPVVVHPAAAAAGPGGLAPFPLPRMPLSVLRWCSAVAALTRARHGTCLAVALLLDPESRRWAPLLPTQACGRRGVRWPPVAADYAPLPARLVLAGSYQTRGAGNAFAAAAAVPAFGGIHLVECRARPRGRPASFAFVRGDAAGEPALGDPAAVLVDDLDQALRDAVAAGRVRVE